MKVAIVGGGLAGVATAYFLQVSGKANVTLFDARGIGEGASGICSGLIHPYPGLHVRRSYKAQEALSITKELIRIAENASSTFVANEHGILRHAFTEEQRERLLEYGKKWGDVEEVERDLFLIHSGITIHSKQYLQGLWQACERLGASYIQEKIFQMESITSAFDQIVVAAGWGVRDLLDPAALGIKFLKGQVLKVQGFPPKKKSFVGNGYIAYLRNNDYYEIGSTYEREFQNDLPDRPLACRLLEKKGLTFSEENILDCKAAVRVMNGGDYLPLVKKIADDVHVFTGLGSRGLLYHGIYAKHLAQAILNYHPFFLTNKGGLALN